MPFFAPMNFNFKQIGIAGAGAMGSGIAQIAATHGHKVILFDSFEGATERSRKNLENTFQKLTEKGKLSPIQAKEIQNNITYSADLKDFAPCGFVLEAIVENLEAKQQLFTAIEALVSNSCILATNTSSLAVTAIGGALSRPENLVGMHFFNPAPLMPLVEIIPGIASEPAVVTAVKKLADDWGKTTVLTKDTPGFIVNRVARPFYGEAIRIYEEGIADIPTIDWAMKTIGGFKMGPFELMDYIGNDVNYTVTETVFTQFFFDPRYKPSLTQKRQVEAKRLGRKSGRGYYNYANGAQNPTPNEDLKLGHYIVDRILAMLINEAADALYLNIATKEDLDLAMTKGVNYPKGLLAWADEIGVQKIHARLLDLYTNYNEDRYRPSVIFNKMKHLGQETFY